MTLTQLYDLVRTIDTRLKKIESFLGTTFNPKVAIPQKCMHYIPMHSHQKSRCGDINATNITSNVALVTCKRCKKLLFKDWSSKA